MCRAGLRLPIGKSRVSGRGGSVLLAGAGRMGSALLRGWIARKPDYRIVVVEPNPSDVVKDWAKAGTIDLNSSVQPQPRAIVLALKPQVIKTERALLKEFGAANAPVISIAAGITTHGLSLLLGPGARVVRAMPNTPGAIGEGITVLFATHQATTEDRELAQSLMAPLGETLWISDETLMDAVTAVSGSGPAYVFLFAEALAAAAREQGLDAATADKLARCTVAGAGALMAQESRPISDLRRDVTSPGGTTEAALNVLIGPDGFMQLLNRAVAAATARGKELGRRS
jgi:pyrroline-5-carboxylate reductase